MKLQKITVAREKLFAAVLIIPHLCRVTFTSSLIYLKSRLPRLQFTSRQVYFASRFKSRLLRIMFTLRHVYRDPVYVASLPLYVTFTSHHFTSQHVFHHVHFSSRLLGFTFLFPPFCFASRSLRAPFARLHVHVLPRLFSVTFISLLVSSPHVLFSPVYLCYVHLTCRFLSFTFTVSLVFFLLRSLRFSFLPSCSLFSPFTLRLVRFAPLNVRPVHFAPHLQTQWLKEATSLHTRTVSGKRVISINAFFWDFAKQRFQRSTFKDAANYCLPSCYCLRILQFNLAQVHLLKHNWWNKKC